MLTLPVMLTPVSALEDDIEADLPKIGSTIEAVQATARKAKSHQSGLKEASPRISKHRANVRELYILALLLEEVAAAEAGSQEQGILHELAEKLRGEVEKLENPWPVRWPDGESSPTPIDIKHVLSVTGRIATIARNAQRSASRTENGYSEWNWDAPKRVAARKESHQLIYSLESPKDVYAAAVMLHEYQKDTGGNPEDWVLQDAIGVPALRLCKLGTKEAYMYFLKLQALYAWDAGEALLFKEMEEKYFGRFVTQERRTWLER